jgi:HAD superfamily hydrolase (TIGR01549 family)
MVDSRSQPRAALRGVLFDLDGVLVDSVRAWHRTIDQGARRRGLPGVSWERFEGTFGQGVDADQRSFFPSLSVEEVFELYNTEFLEHADVVELMPGAIELLDELAARGLRAAVVTNTPRPLAERVLEQTGIGARVQALAAGGDGPEKPDPAPVYEALEALDLGREEVLYVGDSASDAGATAAAGVRFIGRGYAAPERVETLPELLPLLDAAGALRPAPTRLLDGRGAPSVGLFAGAIGDTDLAAYAPGELMQRLRARFGQKRWSYFGVYGPRLIAACCVIDLTYLASCFAFAYDRASGRIIDHHLIGPRLWPCVPDTPCAGHARYGWPKAKATISADGLRRHAGCDIGRGSGRLRFDAWADERNATGLSLVADQGPGAFGSTYKLAGLPLGGSITLGDERISLHDHRAVVDYTHGLPPRDTHWLWASGCGRCADGAELGFNLVSGWNDDVGLGGENAAWFNGVLRPLSPVRFERPSRERWQLRSRELALDFEAETQREQHVDLKLTASIYTQPLGRFSGWLKDGQGRKRDVELAFGVTEDHRARW